MFLSVFVYILFFNCFLPNNYIYFNWFFPFLDSAVCCSHHGSAQMPKLPWVPKTSPFKVGSNKPLVKKKNTANAKKSTNAAVPQLLPVKPVPQLLPFGANALSDLQDFNGTANKQVNTEISEQIDTQVRLNSKIIEEVETLRMERNDILKNSDKMSKENQVLKMKLARATEQVDYLKKKINKSQSDEDIENISPNVNTTHDSTKAA